MASEYLKQKYKDVQPWQTRELTPREKRANWWHYHKWHVLAALAAALVLGDILWHVLGIGLVEPDYQIAYVGVEKLPDDTANALSEALSALGEDCNGDGAVTVLIRQYVGAAEGPAAYSTAITLTADISEGDSSIFLLEDPAGFQEQCQVLRPLEGPLPEGGCAPYEDCVLAWTDCPVLTALPLGSYSEKVLGEEISGDSQQRLAGIYLARRGYWTDKTCDHPEASDRLWEAMTAS